MDSEAFLIFTPENYPYKGGTGKMDVSDALQAAIIK